MRPVLTNTLYSRIYMTLVFQILAFYLVHKAYLTGNCRWSLCGHTAPVSSLRLDPTGALCLSSDSQGRDRSIRVWDLNKGKQMIFCVF